MEDKLLSHDFTFFVCKFTSNATSAKRNPQFLLSLSATPAISGTSRRIAPATPKSGSKTQESLSTARRASWAAPWSSTPTRTIWAKAAVRRARSPETRGLDSPAGSSDSPCQRESQSLRLLLLKNAAAAAKPRNPKSADHPVVLQGSSALSLFLSPSL